MARGPVSRALRLTSGAGPAGSPVIYPVSLRRSRISSRCLRCVATAARFSSVSTASLRRSGLRERSAGARICCSRAASRSSAPFAMGLLVVNDLAPALNSPQTEAAFHVSGPLLVFAGAGSGKTRIVSELSDKAAHSGVDVVFNFGSSSTLATQLTEGAAADIFASANIAQMSAAARSGRIHETDSRIFAKNRLVAITPSTHPSAINELADLAKPGLKVVLADKAVPAGQYALDFLQKASAAAPFGPNYAAAVQKNVVSYEQDVKAVLSKVSLGEADAGIVYATDLVGAAAGLLSRTHHVAFAGGMIGPLIKKFEVGFATGAKATCPSCVVHAGYVGPTPEAYHDPAKAKVLASTQIAAGADVVYHASGASGHGVFEAAREAKVLAIGVDADQHDEMPGVVVTSMVKRADVAVFDVVREARDKKLVTGMRTFGLAEGGVDWVHEGPHAAGLPADVVAKVEALRADVIAGKIKVPRE